jgi:hypothetical protein
MLLAYFDNFYTYTFLGFGFISWLEFFLRRLGLFNTTLLDKCFNYPIVSWSIFGLRIPYILFGFLIYELSRNVCFNGLCAKFWYNLFFKFWFVFSINFEIIYLKKYNRIIYKLYTISLELIISWFFLWLFNLMEDLK